MTRSILKKAISIGTHRGIVLTSINPPKQNTLYSFTHPENKHADYIECDCQLGPHNNLWLHHDNITHQEIPSETELLGKLLNHIKKTNIPLYLELKYYETDPERKQLFCNKIVDYLTEYKIVDRTLIASFDPDLLNLIKTKLTNIPLILNVELNQLDHPCYTFTQTALNSSLMTTINYIAPHIQNYNHPNIASFRHIPKLMWEDKEERSIEKTLQELKTKQERYSWCETHNIVGFTTNTVKEVYDLLY